MMKFNDWKVDDMVINGVEGVLMEGPMSVVEMSQTEAAAARTASANRPGELYIPDAQKPL